MSISTPDRVDALFKKFQGRNNTGAANALAAESPGNVTGVYPTRQLFAQSVPVSEATYTASPASYPWIVKYDNAPCTLLFNRFSANGYKAFQATGISNIIPFYAIEVKVDETSQAPDQYILDFETGILIVYANATTVTISCSAYTGTVGLPAQANPSVLTVAGGTTAAVSVDATGRVGVGLTVPAVALDVSGTLRLSGDISGGAGLSVAGAMRSASIAVTGSLTGSSVAVSGDVSGNGALSIGGAIKGASVAVTGSLTGSSLSVSTDISGNRDLSVTGAMKGASVAVSGAVNAASVAVSGDVSGNGALSIGGAIKGASVAVSGDVSGNGALSIGGAIKGASVAVSGAVNAASVAVSGDVSGNGALSIGGAIKGASVAVSGAVNAASVAVSGDVSGNGALSIGGAIKGASVAIAGALTGDSVTVAGAVNAASVAVSGDVSGNGSLSIGGAIKSASVAVSGAVNAASVAVSGDVSGNGALSIGGAIKGASVTVAGALTGGTVAVSGDISGNRDLSVTGAMKGASVAVTGVVNAASLAVSGDISGNGALSIGGAIKGTSIVVTNDISGNRNLSITGAMKGGSLTTTGKITAMDDISGGATLTITGNAKVGSLSAGDISGSGGLYVTGAAQIGSLIVRGDISGSGALNFTGEVRTKGGVVAGGDISGGGALQITANAKAASLTATGDISGGSLYVTNAAQTGSMTVANALVVNGGSRVAAVTASGDISGSKNLFIDGSAQITNLVISGTSRVAAMVASGDISGAGSLRIGGTVGIGKEPGLGTTLDISGNAQMNRLTFNPGPPLMAAMNTLWVDPSGGLRFGYDVIPSSQQPGGWADTYLLGSPGAPVQVNLYRTSALILVSWQNPTQITTTFSTRSLPAINALRVDVSGLNVTGGTRSLTNTSRLPGDLTSTDPPVTAFAFIKGTGADTVGTYTDGSGNSRVAYVRYLGTDTLAGSTVDLSIWYQGATIGPGVNKLSVTGVGFLTGGGPAAPTSVNGTAPTFSTATVTFTPPTISDASTTPPLNAGENGAPTISSHTLTLTPTGSAWRYLGVFNTNPVSDMAYTSGKTVTGLFPDTAYNVSLVAVNSLGATGTPATTTLTTGPNTGLIPKTIADATYTAATVFGSDKAAGVTLYSSGGLVNDTTAPLRILDGAKAFAFTTPPLALHILENRGSNGNTMRLQCTYGGRTATAITYSANSFGASSALVGTSTDFRIDQKTIDDVGSNENSRFYATSAFDISGTLATALASLSPGTSAQGTIKIDQFFQTTRNGSSFASTPQATKTFTPWLTTLAATTSPTVPTPVAGANAVTATPICGIPMYSTYTGNITGLQNTTNLGAPLYVDKAVSISIAGGTPASYNVVTTTGIPASSYTYTFAVSSYQFRPSITVSVTNINGLTTSQPVTALHLFDPASINRATAQTRWNSPQSNGTFASSGTYSNGPFNNLTSTTPFPANECILYNGFYTGGGSDAFENYTNIGGPDYSGSTGFGATLGSTLLAGYRYVTFKFDSIPVSGSSTIATLFYLNLTFSHPPAVGRATGLSPTTSKNGILVPESTTPIDVLYKCSNGSEWYCANVSTPAGGISISTPRFGMLQEDVDATSSTTKKLKVTLPSDQVAATTIYISVGIPNILRGNIYKNFGVSLVSLTSS